MLSPWFGEEPNVPSKQALVYYALMQAVKQMHSYRAVHLQSKRRFREVAMLKAEEIYECWRRSEGRLGYKVEDACTLLSEVVDGAWAEAFPEGAESKLSGSGQVSQAFLPVRPDLAKRLKEAAAGSKLINLTDDAVEGKLAAVRFGVKSRRIVDLYEAVMLCRAFGLCLMPMELLNCVVERLKQDELKGVTASYREAGASLGLLLRTRERGEALRFLEAIFNAGVFAVTELKLLRGGEAKFKVRCLAPTLTEKTTQLLSAFLEGAVDLLGFRVTSRDQAKGIILLEVEETPEPS